MMWLHPLQRHNIHCFPFEVNLLISDLDKSFQRVSGPEHMSNGSPRICWVCSEICAPVFSNLEPGCSLSYHKIDENGRVDGALDGVRLSVVAQYASNVVGIE